MQIKRHKTRKVKINDLEIGGDAPICVESMTNTDPHDVSATIKQINELASAGCELVRIALPDLKAAEYVKDIKKETDVPLMADIHFDYRIALAAIEYGIDSLRLNPGNIREPEYVKKVVDAVKEKNMTVRIGVNSGSINRKKYPHPTPEALVDSAFEHIKIFEQENFFNIIVSLKSTDVLTTIRAYEIFSKKSDYPLHIGITEAGTQFSGAIKSSVGIGVLLYEGLGDTLRVSLSGNPVTEVTTGYKILQALGLREHGVEVIACPTCGRAEIDVEKIALDIENSTSNINKHIKIAVMGCIVNGPGEAMDADVGVACSKNEAIIFKKGKIIKKITHNQIKDELINAIVS